MKAVTMKSDTAYKNKAAQQYSMTVAVYECKFSAQWSKGNWNWDNCESHISSAWWLITIFFASDVKEYCLRN